MSRQIDRYRNAITTQLVAVEGLPERNGMVMADGNTVWLAGPRGALVRFSPGGERSAVGHPCEDKYGEPLELTTGVRLDDGQLFVANHSTAALLARKGDALSEVETWSLRSERSTAVSTKVAADPAGAVLVAAAADYLHRLARTGKGVFVRDDDDHFWAVAVSRDGKRVANGRRSGKIELRDPETLEIVRVLEGCRTLTLALAFSPDGKTLAVADDSARLFLFDVESGAARQVEGLGKVIALLWTPDGSGLVAVCLSRLLGVIDLADPEYAHHVSPQAEFDRRYLDGGALLGDDTVIARVEKLGVLVTRFAAG